MYTVDYFINKFSKIPEKDWVAYSMNLNGRKCANGHCGVTDDVEIPKEAEALADLLEPLRLTNGTRFNGKIYNITANINDGNTDEYQQPTPKQRILAALYDIKKLQSPEVKEKIVYVAVPVSITEQAKELVMS